MSYLVEESCFSFTSKLITQHDLGPASKGCAANILFSPPLPSQSWQDNAQFECTQHSECNENIDRIFMRYFEKINLEEARVRYIHFDIIGGNQD